MAKIYASRIKKAAVKSMGAKSLRDQAFKIEQKKLEQAQKEIDAILTDAGVPLLNDMGTALYGEDK